MLYMDIGRFPTNNCLCTNSRKFTAISSAEHRVLIYTALSNASTEAVPFPLTDCRAEFSMEEPTQKSKSYAYLQAEAIPHEGNDAVSGGLLHDGKNHQAVSRHYAQPIFSRSSITRCLKDLAISIPAIYFIAFTLLVFVKRHEPVDDKGNHPLLTAAKYVCLP
jgi:hypothetical protein